MKIKTDFSLDDLICIYNCIEIELDRLHLSCIPDTLRDYFNQLNRVSSIIHNLILECENASIDK